jgi:hypothetical protein
MASRPSPIGGEGHREVVEKGAVSRESLAARAGAWERAAEATAHGAPILLANDPLASL